MTVAIDGNGSITGLLSSGPAFRAYRAAALTGVTEDANLLMPFDAVTFDRTGAFSVGTSRFTPQVAGLYQVNWRLMFNSPGGNILNAVAVLRMNGETLASGSQAVFTAGAGATFWGSVGSDIVSFNGSTDYLEVWLYCDVTAGTVTIQSGSPSSYFSASRVPNQ